MDLNATYDRAVRIRPPASIITNTQMVGRCAMPFTTQNDTTSATRDSRKIKAFGTAIRDSGLTLNIDLPDNIRRKVRKYRAMMNVRKVTMLFDLGRGMTYPAADILDDIDHW